ncbi:hypothetical protein Ndes2526B_g01226 [Nannochloris sp. 'desiccata']
MPSTSGRCALPLSSQGVLFTRLSHQSRRPTPILASAMQPHHNVSGAAADSLSSQDISTSEASTYYNIEANGARFPQEKVRGYAEVAYLTGRTKIVANEFPTALGIDDFLHRLEIALYAYGFNGDNAIAMVNLCRDEITVSLKVKIDQVFGSSFNTNGLGGVLTCGVTGVAAGLSHAPVSSGSGKERYVFFSFPHISIDARGEVGTISRPGRPGSSCACGALHQALIDIKSQGLSTSCKIPGVHEPLDPEFTILKQRLARRLRYDGVDDNAVANLNLVDITRVAERTIADDLDYLISHTVDPKKADYAVVTGVQIHNWGTRFDDESPNLEFVAPQSVYVVVNGEKTHLDLNAMPSLTPRQVRILAGKSEGGDARSRGADDVVCNSAGTSTLREIDPPYLYNSRDIRKRQKERVETYADLITEEGLSPDTTCPWPSWQSTLRNTKSVKEDESSRNNSAVHFDSKFSSVDELDELWTRLQSKYYGEPRPSNSDGESD